MDESDGQRDLSSVEGTGVGINESIPENSPCDNCIVSGPEFQLPMDKNSPLSEPEETVDNSDTQEIMHSSKNETTKCSTLSFPPKTIPFRSASFSQVDVSSDGTLYVKNSDKSPIVLKPTAYCLLSSQPNSVSETINSMNNPNPTENVSDSPTNVVPDTPQMTSIVTTNMENNNENPFPLISHSHAKSCPLVMDSNFISDRDSNYLRDDLQESPNKFSLGVGEFTPLSTKSVSDPYIENSQSNRISCSHPDTRVNRNASDTNDLEICVNPEFGSSFPGVNFTLGGDDEPLSLINHPESNIKVDQNKSDEFEDRKKGIKDEFRSEDSKIDDDYNLSTLLMLAQFSPPNPTTSSTTSTSGGDAEDDIEKNQLFRQSSGQSDGSDELQPSATLSDNSCSSPPPEKPLRARHANSTNSLKSAMSLPGEFPDKIASSAPGLSSGISSPPLPTSSGNRKEMTRANSINSGSIGSAPRTYPRGRYYKRLRGPYGEMLEAEMNKLAPTRPKKDYNDHLEFFRESKSSSPSQSTTTLLEDCSTESLASKNPESMSDISNSGIKLSNFSSLLMASMDDLNLTKQSKFSTNLRTRKISANLPLQNPDAPAGPVGFHQRTASSPSQLLYTGMTSTPSPVSKQIEGRRSEPPRLNLDGSPRGHVLAEIVETEKSYVDSLRILVKTYMEPLKSSDFVDAGLVDEIFFQIPTILWHHERLLDALQKRVIDDMQCVGDVLLDAFRQNSLLECYSLFVNNWKNAKGSLKMAVASKPSFSRFIESNARQHKGKLNLDSLLIMPIQRIPRYELLVKELLKYTEPVHDDHSRLILCLDKIKRFALHIDCASVDPNDNREIEIEGWASGLGHLVRQDIVPVCINNSNVRKERALFLFADSLVLASIKRKSTRKPSSNTTYQASNNWEGCKFKLVLRVQLTDVKILNEDGWIETPSGPNTLGTGSVSRVGPSTPMSGNDEMDDVKTLHRIMDLAATLKCSHVGLDDILKEMLAANKHQSCDATEALDLELKSAELNEGPDVLKILFGSTEKKNSWLESFHDTLGKFVRYGFGKTPQVQFVQALPIRKTRAGLQLSCATPVSIHNKMIKSEVSDVWVANSDFYVGQVCILTLHPEPSITSCNGVCNSRITCILAVPPPYLCHSTDINSHHNRQHSPHEIHSESTHDEEEIPKPTRADHKEHWSVWLGTEDGGLHVYDCADSVRVKKNRHKIQHKAPLNFIIYFDGRVFVALGNGDVAVYSRNTRGKGWATNDPSWVTIGSAITPITKMLPVSNFIWCACGSQIKVYGENSGMLELMHTIQVTIDGNQMPRGITSMVTVDDYVWIAVHGSSIIKCYNHTNYECIFETNVAPNVAKILAGCDDIIRQHKSACLRVTALLIAPNKTLWIGTSAGVILTLSPANSADCKIVPLCHGHTGQVRFLSSCMNRENYVISGGDGYEEFRPTPLYNNNPSSFSSMVTSFIGESSGDPSGREDSTNHLLIWKTPKPIL